MRPVPAGAFLDRGLGRARIALERTVAVLCWKCREATEGVRCAGCGALQHPPARADLFEVLELKRSYHLDREVLDSAWRARSRLTHPDRFAGASAVERRMAMQWTATLNEARLVLRNPVSRAWYLATGSGRPPESAGPSLSPDFLEEIFDLRMQAMEEPESVRARVEAIKAELDAEIDSIFLAWEEGRGDLSAVPERLSRLKYVDNLLREL